MRRVAIIGVGMTKFGEHWEKGLRDLTLEAGLKAIEDAGVGGKDIEAGYVGNMAGGSFAGQEHLGALLADYMGLNPIPMTRVEGACASGGMAVRQGFMAVASGMHDVVVVGGVEKMTDIGTEETTKVLGGAGDQEWELFLGATFPGLYAIMATRYMYEFGAKEEHLAMVAVKNHKHGSLNPYAQYQNEITVETVMNSKMIADPLKMFDSSPITDGAAAVVLAPLERAKEFSDTPIEIAASTQASDSLALNNRKSLTSIEATRVAAKKAYDMAGITPKDVDFAEVHDCFTIAELLAIEDLGFFEKGQGYKAVEEGLTYLGGKMPINTSGGLKACGHPVGATGVKQMVEAVWQLRGEGGNRQVAGAEIGLTHNVGGSGATAVVHILKRVN